jgi:hypothetical protein
MALGDVLDHSNVERALKQNARAPTLYPANMADQGFNPINQNDDGAARVKKSGAKAQAASFCGYIVQTCRFGSPGDHAHYRTDL